MKHASVLFFLALFMSSLWAVTIPPGDISGVWTADQSPYEILGNISVPDGQTLQIQPGITIIFTGHFDLICLGSIRALGTVNDSITFTASTSATGWHGIRYMSPATTNESSTYSHCIFEYGKALEGASIDKYGGAFYIEDFSDIEIRNCHFRHNQAVWGASIQMKNASIIIEDNLFEYNYSEYSGAAIRCFEGSNSYIRNNIIQNNTSGIGGAGLYSYLSAPTLVSNIFRNNHADVHGACVALDQSSPLFINDLFVDNTSAESGGAIQSTSVSNPTFINCTISGNNAEYGGALYCYLESDPTFKNTIIYGNTAAWGSQVYLYNGDSDPDFYYCDLEGGAAAFFGNGAAGAYSGVTVELVDADPAFEGTGDHPYQLTGLSGCLNAGNPDTTQTWLPEFDLAGQNRIYNDVVDIGAYEFQGEPIQLSADFTADVTTGSAPLTVQFTDLTSGVPVLWSWDFNLDGTPDSSEQNPTWTYDSEGTYSVSLTVSDGSDMDTEIKFDYIVAGDVAAPSLPNPECSLAQNTPNPFNPETTIRFSLDAPAHTVLALYNTRGQKITTLIDAKLTSGTHAATWNGRDADDHAVSSGVYVYELQVNDTVIDRKRALLLK